MKDARGHGSDGRAGSLGKSGIGIAASFQATSHMKPSRDYTSDAARTVGDLRQRMQGAGPGHQAGLMQGIRNLLGDRSGS
jgi:hypothetical protein